MLINDEASSQRSSAAELIISAILVLTVAVGVYQIQHPRTTHQETSASQQIVQ